ncbi:MAG: hypothetical protein AAF533_14290 [Acidobacteriota bacterium]
MGLFDFFDAFKSGPSERKIDAAATVLSTRHGEPARRYEAADRLAAWADEEPSAIDGLLSRYRITSEKEMSDEEEKAHVHRLLDKLGAEKVVPAIERYLKREPQVGWPLRILSGMVSEDDFRQRVCQVLSRLDTQFDRHPERKVEMIHALMDHASHEEVGTTVGPFLEDTDDTVRMAAGELLSQAPDEERGQLLVNALLDSTDRPRVLDALIKSIAARDVSVAGRKAEVEPLLPEGYYLTRQGMVRRLDK